jgi:hypothetical protein
MAAYCVPRDPLVWFVVEARRVLLSACTVVLVSCGGGQREPATPVESAGPTLPTPMPAPAQLVGGTAQLIDIGASGNPFDVRVARSANGDGFAVWRADDSLGPDEEQHHSLWVNRYSAATAAWGSPFKFETSCPGGAGAFGLTVDARGNAVVAWLELTLALDPCGVLKSARFDAGAGAWATPVVLRSTDAREMSVAGNANGDVMAVYEVFVGGANVVQARYYDHVSGTWQPEAAIEQDTGDRHLQRVPVASLDGGGNALAAWPDRLDLVVTESNYFSRSTGDWVFPANDGVVPSSVSMGPLELAASTDGNFLLAAAASGPAPEFVSEIHIVRFTGSAQTWSAPQTLVRGAPGDILRFQSIASDADGNALVLWTESVGTRTALKAMRLDHAGMACEGAQVIDSAIGGGAEFADLAFDSTGHAIAVWARFEGGRPFVGRNHIAMNRFDGATGTWASALFAEMQPTDARGGADVSANGGQALLGWIQDGAVRRVKALLQPLTDTPSQ